MVVDRLASAPSTVPNRLCRGTFGVPLARCPDGQ